MARSHARDDSGIPEPDREHGLVERDQAPQNLEEEASEPGMMPRFKKRRDDLRFVCWHNKGKNANYRQLNRNHGEVVITGQNPGVHRLAGQPCRYSIHIRVRVSQPIRSYTSVGVNWTRRTLVFVNDPSPIKRERTGAMVGLDRGCVHTLSTSDGRFIDLPKHRLERIDGEIRRRQKSQAHRINMSGKDAREYVKQPSRTYRKVQREINGLYEKAHRIINDWQHKTTTSLVRDYDVIVLEDLNLQGMGRRVEASQTRAGRARSCITARPRNAASTIPYAPPVSPVSPASSSTRHDWRTTVCSCLSTPHTRPKRAANVDTAKGTTAKAKRNSTAKSAAFA